MNQLKMFLDLHIHTIFSLDSQTSPEEYLEQALRLKEKYFIDGLVFMEHRCYAFELDCKKLSEKYNLLVLNGVEAETFWGHILVYGGEENWLKKTDFSKKLDPIELVNEVHKRGGVAVPAHPFRGLISLGQKIERLPHLYGIEALNGANSQEENELAIMYAEKFSLAKTGGSDAHFPKELGLALTEFYVPIKKMEDIVLAIKQNKCTPKKLEELKI